MSESNTRVLVDPLDLIRCQNSDTTTQETTPSPFPSTSSYALTRQTQSKLSEGDGEKEVVNKRRFFLLRFNLLLFIIIG
jgi:hypothetical protein